MSRRFSHRSFWHRHVQSIENNVWITFGAIFFESPPHANGLSAPRVDGRLLSFELGSSGFELDRTHRNRSGFAGACICIFHGWKMKASSYYYYYNWIDFCSLFYLVRSICQKLPTKSWKNLFSTNLDYFCTFFRLYREFLDTKLDNFWQILRIIVKKWFVK